MEYLIFFQISFLFFSYFFSCNVMIVQNTSNGKSLVHNTPYNIYIISIHLIFVFYVNTMLYCLLYCLMLFCGCFHCHFRHLYFLILFSCFTQELDINPVKKMSDFIITSSFKKIVVNQFKGQSHSCCNNGLHQSDPGTRLILSFIGL